MFFLDFLRQVETKDVSVRCGEWDTNKKSWSDSTLNSTDIKAKFVMVHPEFEDQINYNDFAIIVLEDSFDIGRPHIGPICLPEPDDEDISKVLYFFCFP